MGYWERRFKDGFSKVGQEAIDHQMRAKVEGLAHEIGKFRDADDYSPTAYSKSTLITYVRDTFGISIALKSPAEIGIPNDFPFGAIQPPQLDKNHPLVPNYRRAVSNSSDLMQYTKFTRNRAVLGYVDRANAKIHGAIGDIICPLYIGEGLLKRFPGVPGNVDESFKDIEFTNMELAAIVGHELGHVFTYFEKLTSTLVNNMIAMAAANKMMGLKEPKERLAVVSELEKISGKKISDKETIIAGVDATTVYTHVVVELEREVANDMSSEAYANRAWERLADDFSARLGCGGELASALYKIQKRDPLGWLTTRSFMPMSIHVGIEVAFFVGMTILAFGGNPFMAISTIAIKYFAADPTSSLYDEPEERFKAIRQTMIDELKWITKGDAHHRIVEDIARLDQMVEGVQDKLTLMGLVHAYITPGGRKDRKAIEFHKELENYMFNDLYVAAAKHKK